ncbi:MAG: DNA polymerase IV [Candidatus Omnitrophica bacterium]|nr:DNA polymerase IV [Candidatus Omnitrophota bacterium]
MILHIDMDAFFASIEQAINPRLKGKPLIVGSRANKMRTVVCAASYEAKRLGIDSGMPSAEAFRICPHLEFVPADQSKYIWTSREILKLLEPYGLQLNYASIDEFQLDIRETREPLKLAADIRKKIEENFRITASVGIAKNWLLAKLASKLNKPDGVAMLTESNLAETLANVAAEKLCGVGQSTTQTLQSLGVLTCLDLYRKSASFLSQNLGKFGLNLFVSLHAEDSFSDLEQDANPKSVGHSYTLPWPTKTPGFIRGWLRLLSEMVAERLRQQELTAKVVHLGLGGPEIGHFSAQKTFSQASNDGYEIYLRAAKIMAKIGQNMPKIRFLGVTCSNLSSPEYAPLFKEQEKRERLLKTVDRINHRFGDRAIFPAIICQTRRSGQVPVSDTL